MLRQELAELEQKRNLLVSDIHSFAQLGLRKTPGGLDVLEMRFAWLRSDGHDKLSGQTETARISYDKLRNLLERTVEGDGEEWKTLSIPERCTSKIEFHSRRNLRAVAENPGIRHKLGVFLSKSLHWPDYTRFVLSDDWLPYSFFFQGETPYGRGICGGIILHGQEDLTRAQYSLHT